MFDGYEVNAFSDDSDYEEPRKAKGIRRRPNYFEEYDRKEFFCRFRLSPRTVTNIIEEIEDIIRHPTNRNDALSPENQVLLALNFYASGSFLRVAGDAAGVSKSAACKTIRRVSIALSSLRAIHIRMPETAEEISECRQKFFQIARFPRCIGAIDCTHVKIQSPGGENAEIFRNRKQFFSLNVQSISSADLRFQNIVARWPGSAHDSHIFRNSSIHTQLENGRFGSSIILGDSGYPVKRYLLTPLLQPRNQVDALYNESQIRTRNVVERQFGVWKRRFPVLATGLRLKLDTTQAIVVATAVLHNIACNESEDVPPVNAEQEAAINFADDANDVQPLHIGRGGLNNMTRANLIENYFATL